MSSAIATNFAILHIAVRTKTNLMVRQLVAMPEILLERYVG